MIAQSLEDLPWTPEPASPGLHLAQSQRGQVMICEISQERKGPWLITTGRGTTPLEALQRTQKGLQFTPIHAIQSPAQALTALQRADERVQEAMGVAAKITQRIIEAFEEGALSPELLVQLLGVTVENAEEYPAFFAALGIEFKPAEEEGQ